MFILHKSKN